MTLFQPDLTPRTLHSRLAQFALSIALTLSGCAWIGSAFAAPVNTSKPAKKSSPARVPVRIADSAPFEGKIVGTIDLIGLKRIEKDAVQAKIQTKPGQPLDRAKIKQDIYSIYGMGYFDEIEFRGEAGPVDTVNLKLVIKERPVISKIEFDGNERISESDLREVTKLKEYAILDIKKIKDDVAALQKHYEEKGYYLAKVRHEIQKGEKPEEVKLVFKINDYDKVQIKGIRFLNNVRYSEVALKNIFAETKEGSFFSFLSGSGSFKESSFKQDMQRLAYHYFDHGYVKFKNDNPVVTISEDKRGVFISVHVDEGEQYKIGNLAFSGDLLYTRDELLQDLTLLPEDIFAISKRNADIIKLTEKYQDLGYAFANVVPKMQVNDEARTVDIDYEFEKGSLVYINEINMLGNSKTWDKVIRREMRIHEGELFNGTRLRISKENIERLGYFAPGEVSFNTVPLKGKPDLVNIEVTIKERSTGTITLGAGYGSVQKFFFTTQISEINLFGRGQSISLAAQYSADSSTRSFNLGFTDPYAFDTRWSLGFDIYSSLFQIPDRYRTRRLGFDVRAGYPLADYVNGFITYKNEGLQTGDAFATGIPDAGLDDGVLSSVTFSVIRDKRNNRYETSAGNYQSASLELAGVGGDKKFVKWTLNNRYYKRLVGDLVLRNNFETGHIYQTTDRGLPPSEKFFLGGPNNMRGYRLFGLSPSAQTSTGFVVPTGGVFEVLGMVEFEHPIIKEAGIKFVTFFDIGNSFDKFPIGDDTLFSLRADAGFGFRWFSPIGPLRFEWGYPFSPRGTESSPEFQFFIGPPF